VLFRSYDPRAFAEFYRVLDECGRLVWVDAGRLLPCNLWNRVLNRAFDAVNSNGTAQQGVPIGFTRAAEKLLARAGFEAKTETVQDDASVVLVVTATKEGVRWTNL
jgi:hypothetical protein